LDADDEFHVHAARIYDHLLSAGSELWVTSYLRLESIAIAHRRLGFESVESLVASLDAAARTMWADESLYAATWAEFVQRRGERFSFVDCSTVLAARGLMATIFTFDSGFALEGLPVVP
jgi:predicted nucleic acid-binding protein